MVQRKTNVEFVTDLMEFSQFGPLSQLFIIEAIRLYANEVASADDFKGFETAFFSGEDWQSVAFEIKRKLDDRLAR